MYFLYSLFLVAYFLVVLPFFVYRTLRHGNVVGRIKDRLGFMPDKFNPDQQRSIWIHAVSVGEVLAARSLLADLRRIYPTHQIFISTTTVTGQELAHHLDETIDGTFYIPLDFSSIVNRTLNRVLPDLLVLIDTEIWPNLLRLCHRSGVRTVLLNGRISDRSYKRYRLTRMFMRRVFENLDHVCAQNEVWAQRFLDLGVPIDRITVSGSLKFDAVEVASVDSHTENDVMALFRFAANRPVLIAASTLRGEEATILSSFSQILKTHHDALLIIAPRHPERFEETRRLAIEHGFEVVRRSDLVPDRAPTANVILLNTIGELAKIFKISTVVFVGGSLVKAGGHNILEPAVFGKAVVFGPYMQNFSKIAEMFVKAGAAWQVSSAKELEDALIALLDDPIKRSNLGLAAQSLVEVNRGAKDRSLEIIARLLPSSITS